MKHNFVKRYYDAGAGAAAGGPSMADLLNPDYVPPVKGDAGNGEGGVQEGLESDGVTLKAGYARNNISGKVEKDPNYKEPNPGTKPPKPAAPKPGAEEGLNADGTLKEGYIRENGTDKIIKDPNFKATDDDEEEEETGLNEDGSLKPGFIKNTDGTVVPDPDYVEEDETGEKFIAAVEAITGRNYEIEYPEGVFANTPEGIAHRENVIRETAQVDFEEYLKKKDPRGYAYLLHRDRGLPDEEFFGDHKGFQLPTVEELKASADVQAAVYKHELLMKGLDATTAQILIDAATKDNTLEAKSTLSHTSLDTAQKKQLADLQKQQEDATKVFKENVGKLTNSIAASIKSEMGFVVPEANQAEFQQYVLSNMRYDNGEFFFVQPIAAENMKTTLEALFFQYKKGDLSKLIAKKAKTQAAQTLRLKVPNATPKPGSGGNAASNTTNNVPLSQLM